MPTPPGPLRRSAQKEAELLRLGRFGGRVRFRDGEGEALRESDGRREEAMSKDVLGLSE